MRGFVYVLSNVSMPGLLKIGKTTRTPEQRATELFQTGVPTPFKVEDYVEAPDCDDLETRVHWKMSTHRVDPGREFFKAPVHDAVAVLIEEHRRQLDEWLNAFLPDHEIVNPDLSVSEKDVSRIASKFENVDRMMVASALADVTADDLTPAINRVQKRIESARARRLSKLRAVE